MAETEKITKILNQHNVEISKNSRGWNYSVKAYGDTPEELKTVLKSLMAVAKEVISEEAE